MMVKILACVSVTLIGAVLALLFLYMAARVISAAVYRSKRESETKEK